MIFMDSRGPREHSASCCKVTTGSARVRHNLGKEKLRIRDADESGRVAPEAVSRPI